MVFRGLKTWLPSDVRKQLAVKAKLIDLYEQWSYEPIVVQSLVDIDVINKANKKFTDKTFTFLDKDGEMIALRTELTQPIAKSIAGRSQELEFPLKLYYDASVFRYKGSPTDESREIQQVGIEYIGAKATENYSDSEVLQLLIDSAKQFSLENFQISLTDTKIWEAIFEKLPKEIAEKAYNLALNGDFLNFTKLTETNEILKAIYSPELLRLNSKEQLEYIEKLLNIELNELKSLVQISTEIQIVPYQCPDLDLYTGIHFKLIVRGQGIHIAMGGRYDNLYASFGEDLPAIGFAFYIPRLISALANLDLLEKISTKESSIELKNKSQSWGEIYQEAQNQFKDGNKVLICNK